MTVANTITSITEIVSEIGISSVGLCVGHEGTLNSDLPEKGFKTLNRAGTSGSMNGTIVTIQNRVRPSIVASFTSGGHPAHVGTT
jgi:hypothetical protein